MTRTFREVLLDARAAAGTKRYADAERLYAEALALNPDSAAASRGQAEATSLQRRESSRNLVAMAQAAAADKRLDEAQRLFAQALELNPESVAAAKGPSLAAFRLLLASAQAALSEKRFAEAEHLFEAAVAMDATSKPALRGFAQVASDSGQWPAALDRWSRFVETWPTDPHGYTRLLVASIRRADFSSLTRAIETASDYARGNRDFWFAAIMPALFRLGRFHEARQASERFPKAEFTIANWAAYTTILHQTSQHDAIAKDYRDHMPSLNEDRTYTHYVLVALHKAGAPDEFDGALQRLRQAPAEHRLASLSRMLPSMLDEQTRRDLTRNAIDTGWLFKDGRNFVTFIDKVPEAMFPELQAAIDNLPNAAFKIVASHAFLRSLQLHRLAEAAVGNTSWASLAKESAGIHDRVHQMAAAADDEF